MKKLEKLLYLFLTLMVLTSCQNKLNMARKLELLKSKPMVLPIKQSMFVNTDDSVFCDYSNEKLKLVVYFDSLECSKCAMSNMYEWENIISLDTVYSGRIKYYFIFSPKSGKYRSTIREVKYGTLDYPSFIDKSNYFTVNNPNIPADRRFHVFLLDEKNNIILIGNPLLNKKINRMFLKEVADRLHFRLGQVSYKHKY